jgi:hypothetical protein
MRLFILIVALMILAACAKHDYPPLKKHDIYGVYVGPAEDGRMLALALAPNMRYGLCLEKNCVSGSWEHVDKNNWQYVESESGFALHNVPPGEVEQMFSEEDSPGTRTITRLRTSIGRCNPDGIPCMDGRDSVSGEGLVMKKRRDL